MSTPLRPMARTSSCPVVVTSAPANLGLPGVWDAYDCALCHSSMSIVCPDILTCDHAGVTLVTGLVGSPEVGGDVPLEVELDRSSPIPLYYQLAQAIEAAIRDG